MPNTSTLQHLEGRRAARLGRQVRWTALGLMVIGIGLSFLGVYGPSERTVTTTDEPYELTMTYGSVVRSGQAVPMEIRLSRAGGFTEPITLVFDQRVFDRFDFQNWYPNPSAEVGEGGDVVYEFDPPDGDTLGISLDARVAPTQWGDHATYTVAVDVAGETYAETEYVVWVMP